MLDTGYDHKEVENLVMLRPTQSAIKYAQMRGRGSRLCPRIQKNEFIIYDFVGNSRRFNDPGEIYHAPKQIRTTTRTYKISKENFIENPSLKPEFLVIAEGSLDDEIRVREIIIIGPEGIAIDRKSYREKWEEKIVVLKQTDAAIEKIFHGEKLSDEEWENLAQRLNSPEYYFNEGALRRAFEQPTGSLSDFIRFALGIDRFLSREERIEKAFNTWVVEHSSSINPAQAQMLRLLKARVMAGEEITMKLFSQPPFSLWGGLTRMEQLFGKDKLLQMVDELNSLLAAA
jgi:type I restriction enzyme R subunit